MSVARRSIVSAIETVMVVMVVVVVSAIPGHDDDVRIVAVMVPIKAMVMMVVVMIKLGELDVTGRLNWRRFVNRLKQGDSVRDRLQQVGE